MYLRMQPYRQASVAVLHNLKLAPRYFGPYPILYKIGSVAYRLGHPNSSKIHHIFQVSQLKKAIAANITLVMDLPVVDSMGLLQVKLVATIATRTVQRKHVRIT